MRGIAAVLSVTMPKNNMKYYYAVGKGRQTGVFDNWPDCKKQIDGIANAKYKKFPTVPEAEEFVNYWKCYVSPKKFEPQTRLQQQAQSPARFQPQALLKQQKQPPSNHQEAPLSEKVSIAYNLNILNGLGVEEIKKENSTNDNEEGFIPLETEDESNGIHGVLKLSDSIYDKFPKVNLKNIKFKPPLTGVSLSELEETFKRRKSLSEILPVQNTVIKDKESLREVIKDILKEVLCQFKEKEQPQAQASTNENLPIINNSGASIAERLDSLEKKFENVILRIEMLQEEVRNIKQIGDHASDEPSRISSEPKEKPKLKRKRSRSRSKSNEKEADPTPSTSTATDDLVIKKEKTDFLTFDVGPDDYVNVYTDGCCHNNGRPSARAGIGIYFGDDHPLNVSQPLDGPATNNNGEIQAARAAIELAAEAGVTQLKILTDSGFLIDCVNKYMKNWKCNGWKLTNGQPVKNRVELEKLDKAMGLISVKWEKVPAHKGIHGNEMADQLANEGAKRYRSR